MSAEILMLNGAAFCLAPPIGGLLITKLTYRAETERVVGFAVLTYVRSKSRK